MSEDALSPEQRAWIEHAAPRVEGLARAMAQHLPHATEDDLLSAGYEGLVQAARRYDPSHGVPFVAFAHFRVRGAMLDAARRAAPALRLRTRAQRAFEATQSLLEAANRRAAPTAGSDPRSLQERVAAAAELVTRATTAVLVSKLGPEDPDAIEDLRGDAEARLLREETHLALQNAIDECSPEDRSIVEALYFRGLSMHEYARELGKSASTISRRHARIVARLARRLHAVRPGP